MIESALVFVFFVILRITAGVYAKRFDWLTKTILPLDIICWAMLGVTLLLTVILIISEIKKAVANSSELKLKKAQYSATIAANKAYIRQVKAERKKAKAKPKGVKPRGKK